MASIASRSVVLVVARLSNYAVLMLSPIFLVRLLDVGAYGQYREFTLYAMFAAVLIQFSIKSSLLYFLPKDSPNERVYFTHSALLLLVANIVGLSLIALGHDYLVTKISFDFIYYLIAYVFFFLNLDFVEPYWLAKKRSDYVLVYSALMTSVRTLAVILAAYLFQDVAKIILCMIAVEGVKFFALLVWVNRFKLIVWKIDSKLISDQLSYILPLGFALLIFNLNRKIGSMFVASMLGAAPLAMYSIGMYQIPIIGIVRSAVSDVIFPDMVQRTGKGDTVGIALWQKSNLLFCLLVFPGFLVFFVFAELFITMLFTDQYFGAVPIFQMMLLLMVRQCFDMATPLRAKNLNRYFLQGNLVSLVLNILLILVLYEVLGLPGPAAALIITDVLMAIYLTTRVISVYSLTLSTLFMWGKLAKLVSAALAGLPVLLAARAIDQHEVLAACASILVYGAIYYWLVRRMNIPEVEVFIGRMFEMLTIMWARMYARKAS